MDTGVEKDNIFIMSNGDALPLLLTPARIAGHFNAQDIYVDGNRIGEIGAAVPKDRRDLSEDGVVLAVATVDFKPRDDPVWTRYPQPRLCLHERVDDLIRQRQRIPLQCYSYRTENKDASVTQSMVPLSTLFAPSL